MDRDQTDIVERSDEYDQQLHAVGSWINRTHLLVVIAAALATAAFLVMAVLLMWLELRHLSESNNRLLQDQIPAYQEEITDRDEEIQELTQQVEGLEYVLNRQALPAILQMSKQIEELGGKPPRVVLQPPSPEGS